MKRKIGFIIVLITVLLGGSVVVFAVPPLKREFLKKKPAGFKPCRAISFEQVKKLQAKGAIRKAAEKGIKTPETKKVIVLRVQFAGMPITKSQAEAEALFSNLKDYFYENSYGVLTVTSTVTSSTYTLSSVSLYNDESAAALGNLWKDSVDAAAAGGVNFTAYDYVMIYHQGYGEEQTGDLSDLWSLYCPGNAVAPGKTFDGFTVVPELSYIGTSSLGVICHEFGHQLGLPDLYDTSVAGGRSTCGAWSLMDYPYGFNGSGINPPHLDPWCKNFLMYIDLSARVAQSAISDAYIGDIETSQTTGYYKIPVDVGTNAEYFITEYRRPDASRMKYDLTLPATGIIIWHIDDTLALDPARFSGDNNSINTGSPHLGIDLVEGDGTPAYPPGKAGDVFREGSSFSTPQSDAFNKMASGIALASISFAGDRANFMIRKIAASGIAAINKTISYPNPSGPNYSHPRSASGVLTTIVFHSSRPPGDISLGIYNIAGERVHHVYKPEFSLKLGASGPSTDYKWVYEYDWNGKNDSGEDVAPGLYLYRIKADDSIKTGKLAIVR